MWSPHSTTTKTTGVSDRVLERYLTLRTIYQKVHAVKIMFRWVSFSLPALKSAKKLLIIVAIHFSKSDSDKRLRNDFERVRILKYVRSTILQILVCRGVKSNCCCTIRDIVVLFRNVATSTSILKEFKVFLTVFLVCRNKLKAWAVLTIALLKVMRNQTHLKSSLGFGQN